MAKKNAKIQIVSINYLIDGVKHKMKPATTSSVAKKKKGFVAHAEPESGEEECTPGETRCVNHKLQRCIDIGEGQCIWMDSTETC
jgi:hypothetical protein